MILITLFSELFFPILDEKEKIASYHTKKKQKGSCYRIDSNRNIMLVNLEWEIRPKKVWNERKQVSSINVWLYLMLQGYISQLSREGMFLVKKGCENSAVLFYIYDD